MWRSFTSQQLNRAGSTIAVVLKMSSPVQMKLGVSLHVVILCVNKIIITVIEIAEYYGSNALINLVSLSMLYWYFMYV